MKCSQCGFENDVDAEYCEECGTPLKRLCPHCGSLLKPGAKFCKKCGASVSSPLVQPGANQRLATLRQSAPSALQEKIRAVSSQIEGERKLVTILFTDIVGSTSLAEKLDPEEWKEIVSGAHQRVSQSIYRYEGTIAQLLGDGVLAFFGAPITHEDDPLRALRAALDIQNSIAEYERELQGYIDHFQMRIGLHTGTVVVGSVGSDLHMEYLAVGDAVNLAARLQSAALPGTVLISESTARLVKASFELQSLGDISVKGKAEPVSVFEVLKGKAVPESPRGFEELHSSLVGRDSELALLREALTLLAGGHGQIVTVLGEAGIGKSRLVEEAHHSPSAGSDNVHWVEGRALSYGTGLSFWTITQLLFSDLGLSDGDPEARIRTALKRRVNELFGEQAAGTLPYLFHLMGVKLEGEQAEQIAILDGETLKHQILISVVRYFEQIARKQPTVMVFEDLHWADPSSLEALELLLASTDRVPLLLLLVTRIERELPTWRTKQKAEAEYGHRYTEIPLKPLTGSEQNQLVDNLLTLAELPLEVRQLILARAEGNPFYLEEVIRSLIDQGALVHQGERWQPAGDIQNISIPTTLQGVLLARIDRLQEDVRHTLQLAAVIGKSFLYRLLEAIAEAEQELDRHLALLQRADLVREKSRLPELEYIFKHSLTQEAAYDSLLLERRREFHQRVGEALEQLFADRKEQYLGLLAHHFEASGDQEKAVGYLIKAGDQARLTDEHNEAMAFYQRALKLLKELHDESRAAAVWLKLGLIYHANFQFDASHQAYETAFNLQRRIQNQPASNTGLHTLRVEQKDSFITFDPGKARWADDNEVVRTLMSGLARINGDLDVIPEVARSWQVLEEGRKYIFHLRNDFTWSDGTPVNAGDFEYAWKRNLDPATGSDTAVMLYDVVGARDFHQGITSSPDQVGVRALDAYTLEVLLTEPVAYFPFVATLSVAFPLPRTAIERYGKDWWQPGQILSNGPFRLVELDPELICTVERNPDYPRVLAGNVGRIEWKVIREEPQLLQAYRENSLDIATIAVTRVPEDLPKEEVFQFKILHVSYLVFDPSHPPLNDPRVRKAIVYAIDRRSLQEQFHISMARGGLIPPGMPGHSPDINYEFNPDLGRKLLAEAGYPGGIGFPGLSLVAPQIVAKVSADNYMRQWRENLGVEVDFQGAKPWEIEDWKEGRMNSAMMINGWLADYPDPDNFLRQSDAISMLNFFGWRDAEYDQLVEEAARTPDRGKRMAMYRKADHRLVAEQALVVPYFYGFTHIRGLVKPWVKNFRPNLLGTMDYQDVVIEEH